MEAKGELALWGALGGKEPSHPHLPPPLPTSSTGTLEFTVKGKSVDSFFPVQVTFSSVDTLCPIALESIVPADAEPTDKPLRYSVTKTLSGEYTVE